MKLEFSQHILKKILKYYISLNSVQWEANLFHAGRRTDMAKLLVAFSHSVNAPYNLAFLLCLMHWNVTIFVIALDTKWLLFMFKAIFNTKHFACRPHSLFAYSI